MFPSSSSGVLFFVLSASLSAQANHLFYKELRSLNVSCYPRDSCHRLYHQEEQEDEAAEVTCECDATCYRRGTCCIDSPYPDSRLSSRSEICDGETIIGVGHYYYFDYPPSTGFFQVTKCERWWNGPVQVEELCEIKDPVDGVDLMVAIPVTNINSGVTYKNYFCALCNYDIEGSVLWDVGIYQGLEYSLLSDRFTVEGSDASADSSDDITEGSGTCNGRNTLDLVYSEEKRFYGYWDNCSYSLPRFVSLEVQITIPQQLLSLVKGCRTDLVSECPLGWRDTRVRLKCAAYLGILKGPPTIENVPYSVQYFRNAHCAICNNVTSFEGFSCEQFSVGAVTITPTYPTSLTVLFGHLLSDEGCLGNNERFLKGLGCRAVLCANPRHKVKNGKCAAS